VPTRNDPRRRSDNRHTARLGPAQLKKLLATVGHGDVVIVAAVDRLSRDTTDSMVIARDLHKALACVRSACRR
jgi:DNA invertase Pin-like site-specific DNA recombinase